MEYQPVPRHYSKVAMNQHLTFTVLSWLREFRFASPQVLSQLTDIPLPYNGNLHRFMSRLMARSLVEEFHSRHEPKLGVLFRLGPDAPAFMELHGLPHDHTYIHPRSLESSRTLLHDLNVQMIALRRLDTKRPREGRGPLPDRDPASRVYEVLGEAQLSEGSRGLPQPDLIMRRPGASTAYEYEMTRKSTSRIYYALTNHLRAIREGHYVGVCYMFPNARIRDIYEDLYMQPLWPETTRYSNGRVISHGRPFNPDDITGRGNPQQEGPKAIQFTVETYISPIKGQ